MPACRNAATSSLVACLAVLDRVRGVSIGEIRADIDAVAAILDQLSGSYRTGSQQVQNAATALSGAAKDSNRPELSDAVSVAHLAAQEADHAAITAAEARRLCSAYAWQL
jgi:hypothetical protein